ncbi:MAG TPA: DinB family protein [Abditibacterium sp.]|jgi:uncharacterized damage-inducible protein DinB
MMETQIYSAMTRYNRWMNNNLLEACAQIPDEARKRDLGAPFGSIHGLWNHILVADRIWLARFTEQPMPYSSLNTEVCVDFADFRVERAHTDDAIDAFIASLSAEKLTEPFSFVPLSSPIRRTLPFYIVVSHLFNHQTHHRGQISALLEHLGGDCGVTDLAAMQEWQME